MKRILIAAAIATIVLPTFAQAQLFGGGGSTIRGVGGLDCSNVALRRVSVSSDRSDWSYELAGICKQIFTACVPMAKSSTAPNRRARL